MSESNKRKRVKLYDKLLPSQTIKLITRLEASHYWQMLAYVDVVKELNPVRQGSCRYCYGIDNQYQFTLNEMRIARRSHLLAQLKIRDHNLRSEFDEQGGDGYNPCLLPNRDCPECHGFGMVIIVPLDFNKLSPAARMLYDGIKLNRDGSLELKLRSRDRAMENLQKLMGFDVEVEAADFEMLSDAALDASVQRAITKGFVSLEDLKLNGDLLDNEVELEYSK